MNVEIGAEAAKFPEKEYIRGIAIAMRMRILCTFRAQKVSNFRAHPF